MNVSRFVFIFAMAQTFAVAVCEVSFAVALGQNLEIAKNTQGWLGVGILFVVDQCAQPPQICEGKATICPLGREDVLSVGDLDIKEAIKRLCHLEKRPDAAQMEAIAEPWRPQQTLASRYFWWALDKLPTSESPR